MARPGPQGGQYRPPLEEQILRIHQASLTVLETTGIKVENEEALCLFQSGGAGSRDDRVFLSTSVVEPALETVPSRLVLAGRDPSQDADAESLAAEAIDRVGPAGHYLMDAHTVRSMRSEWFHPCWPTGRIERCGKRKERMIPGRGPALESRFCSSNTRRRACRTRSTLPSGVGSEYSRKAQRERMHDGVCPPYRPFEG